MLRLFFALPCPTKIAAQIDAWRQDQHFAGKPVPAANLHVTLAFLGQVPQSRVQLLQRVPPKLALADLAFDLNLDRLDCWPEGLLHLAPSQPPQTLLKLARALQQQLKLQQQLQINSKMGHTMMGNRTGHRMVDGTTVLDKALQHQVH